MKKHISLILAALITVLTAASCAQSDTDAPLDYKEISSDDVEYDLYVPEEWQPDISTGMTAAYYSSQDPSNISMIAFELDGTVKTIEDYWNSYLPSLIAVFPDIAFENVPAEEDDSANVSETAEGETTAETETVKVGEPEHLTLDGVPALAYSYTASMSGVNYKFYQVISFHSAQIYIFTYTAEVANYDAHIEDVVGMLGNFRFH